MERIRSHHNLGANSFHMVVTRVVNGAIQVLSRLKRRVHLADGLDEITA